MGQYISLLTTESTFPARHTATTQVPSAHHISPAAPSLTTQHSPHSPSPRVASSRASTPANILAPSPPLDLLTSSPHLAAETGSHHSPTQGNHKWQDVEAIRLSRQDNPYLQVRGSSLN